MLKLAIFVVILGLVCGDYPPTNSDTVVYCIDNKTLPSWIPISPPCVTVTKNACLDLNVTLTINGKAVFGPKNIPLRLILQSQERGFCETTDLLPNVAFCGNVTSLEYNEKDKNLRVCLSLNTQLTPIPGFPLASKSFPIPCFNIKDCEFPKTCVNNCSNQGICVLGVCQCYPGKFGIDCGAELKENCISTGPKSTCWKVTEPTCRHVDVEVIETQRATEHLARQVHTTTPIDILFPCTRNISDLLECVDCVSLHDVLVVGNALRGSPAVTLTCGGVPLQTQKYPLQTLIDDLQACNTPVAPSVPAPVFHPTVSPRAGPVSPSPVSPEDGNSPSPDDQDWIDRAKGNKGAVIIAAVVIIVVLLALVGVGFYLYKRCSKQNRAGAYQTVSSVDPFDGTPMQDDADAINYSFSSDQESN